MRNKAKLAANEILREILGDTDSLTLLLVRAYRLGHNSKLAVAALDTIARQCEQAKAVYLAAIAQPEPKVRTEIIEL